MRPLLAAAFLLAFAAHARSASITFDESEITASAHSASLIHLALARGSSVTLELKNHPGLLRGAGRRWTPEGLEALLSYRGSYRVGAEAPAAGAWMTRTTLPRILLIENNSTVAPLSKSLAAWNWPLQSISFEEVEKAPKIWLDPSTYDVVVFSSPGWWQNFANPPSGPSRIPEAVAEAARGFVSGGGSAVFFDIAQWDLEKIWPKSLRLSSLGPYQVSSFKAAGEGSPGQLALAPFGMAAEKLYVKGVAHLFYSDSFGYPDGNEARADVGYAFPDPLQGSGVVAAFAFHPFEQDDSLAGLARRVVLNLLLSSGSKRVAVSQDSAALAPATDTPVPTQVEELTFPPSFTMTPIPTLAAALPSSTSTPSPRPTLAATATPWPTATWAMPAPTRAPSPPPTLRPTLRPSTVPTAWPTALPTAKPTPIPAATMAWEAPKAPLVLATLAPTLVPWPSPKPKPTQIPRASSAQRPPLAARIHDALGCLESSPEPFSEGGVYIFFCLKHAASVRLKVFSAKGILLYTGATRFLPPGSHQEFYGGVDASALPLKAGRYRYRMEAQYDGQNAEWRQSEFNLKRKKR